jgi:hypothetical protein
VHESVRRAVTIDALAVIALALAACSADRGPDRTADAADAMSTTTTAPTTTAPPVTTTTTTTTTLPPTTTTAPPTSAPPSTSPPIVVTQACDIHAPYNHPVNANCWMTEEEFIDARLAELTVCLDEIMAGEPCP